MSGMITRACRINHVGCKHLTKEKLVNYLNSSSEKCNKVPKIRKQGKSNEMEVKIPGDKKGFCQEDKRQKMQNKRYSKTYGNLGRKNLRSKPLIAVYDRITRAKSKNLLETQTKCSNGSVDVACMNDLGVVEEQSNTLDGKKGKSSSERQARKFFCQSHVEFSQDKRMRMIEGRMTRAKKNLLLQIQANRENAGSECLHKCTCRDSRPLEVDSRKDAFLTYNSVLQRKRKRMFVNMYSDGLEGYCCISEKGLQTEPGNKSKGNDMSEQESRCRVITRSAMYKSNLHMMMKDPMISTDNQSNGDLKKQCEEIKVADKEHLEFTDSVKLRKKLKSCKDKVFKEKGSNAGSVLAKPPKSQMQSGENEANFKDSQYWSRNLRKKKCSADTKIVNPVQMFLNSSCTELRQMAVEPCTTEASTRAKVIATATMPRRVTRSMDKYAETVENLQEELINKNCVMPHRRERKEESHALSMRDLCRIKKISSSSTVECMEEMLAKGEPHTKDKDGMELNTTDEANLNSSSELDIKNKSNSACNDSSGTNLEMGSKGCSRNSGATLNAKDSFQNGCCEPKLFGLKSGIEESEGKGLSCRVSKRKKKQNSDFPRKEYLTRSKHEERNIQECTARCLASEIQASSLLCDNNDLTHNTGRAVNAFTQLMPHNLLPPKHDQNVPLEIKSASPPIDLSQQKISFRESAVQSQSVDLNSESYRSPNLEHEASFTEDTSVLEQMEKSLLGTQASMLSHEQINNDILDKWQGCFLVGSEIKGPQRPNLSILADGGQSIFTPTSNSEVTDIQSEAIVDPNDESSRKNMLHLGSSHDCHGNYCVEMKRKGLATVCLSNKISEQGDISHEKALDDPDGVERGDYGTTDGKRKGFWAMTNPKGIGGRQMRPRPLDLKQPLPIFIEGRDQEFYDHDGVPSSLLKKQEMDISSNFTVDAAAGSKVDPTDSFSSRQLKKQDIKIPSYRTVDGYDEVRRCLSGGEYASIVQGPYIRHTETTDKSQMNVVEYDMDDDDQDWLQKFNGGIAEGEFTSPLSEDEFEKLIEYFEKESARVSAENHILVPLKDDLKNSKDKKIPTVNLKIEKVPISDTGKCVLGLPWEGNSSMVHCMPRTSDCCICNGGENSGSNPIYRCESCLIYVHQSCYGIHERWNEGEACSLQTSGWLCRKCETFGSANVDVCCAICCKKGGALKPTTDPAKWAHVVCALYTNETFFVNTDLMEPIDGISAVEVRSRRQKRLCCFCGARLGSCERCSVYGCGVTFHISCGVNWGAYFELQHAHEQVVYVRSFCPRHANVAPVSSIVEKEACLNDKELAYEKGINEEDWYTSVLHSLSTILPNDQTGSSEQQHKNDKQLQYAISQNKCTGLGFLGEESNIKDESLSLSNCQSFPKQQRRQNLRHSFQSGARKERFRSVIRRKMLGIDDGSNDICNPQKDDDGDFLYLMDKSPKLQGPQLSEHPTNRDPNLGLVEGSISDHLDVTTHDSDRLIKLEEVLKANVGPAFVVNEVYSHWLSKRTKNRGPLLQNLQQEQTAKKNDIFNRDFAGIRAYFGLKEHSSNTLAGYGLSDFKIVLEKLMGLQKELELLRSIAKLVIDRERIKAQLFSVLQRLAELELFALQKKLGLMCCFSCKSSQDLLHCAYCMRIFCFQCYKLWNCYGMKSYRILCCRKCICKDCEGVSKSEYINPVVDEVSMGLIGSLWRKLPFGSATVKPDGEGKSKGSEEKTGPFSTGSMTVVCSPSEHTTLR
eukprot:Gb_37194 [translate_table: standard]